MSNLTIEEEIKAKAELMAQSIKSGKSIELHPCKDGVRMFVVDKKVVK